MALMDALYRGAAATELATGFCLPCCRDGHSLLGFVRVLLPCVYVLLLVIISVGNALEPHSPTIWQHAGRRPPRRGRPRRALFVGEGGAARHPILQRVDRRLSPPALLAWSEHHGNLNLVRHPMAPNSFTTALLGICVDDVH
ncbi:hypothetical protein VPH35_128073 [Triticum aestivum]